MKKEPIKRKEMQENQPLLRKSSLYVSFLLLTLLGIASCKPAKPGNPERFKEGVFEIPAGEGYSKTIVTRKDSLQIEEYYKITERTTENGLSEQREKKVDTLYITWKNNFFYTLSMKSPKTDLDKDKIFVQITAVKDSSYNFTAKIGYSDFEQRGEVFKVK